MKYDDISNVHAYINYKLIKLCTVYKFDDVTRPDLTPMARSLGRRDVNPALVEFHLRVGVPQQLLLCMQSAQHFNEH